MTTMYELMGDCGVGMWISAAGMTEKQYKRQMGLMHKRQGRKSYQAGIPFMKMESRQWKRGWREAEKEYLTAETQSGAKGRKEEEEGDE